MGASALVRRRRSSTRSRALGLGSQPGAGLCVGSGGSRLAAGPDRRRGCIRAGRFQLSVLSRGPCLVRPTRCRPVRRRRRVKADSGGALASQRSVWEGPCFGAFARAASGEPTRCGPMRRRRRARAGCGPGSAARVHPGWEGPSFGAFARAASGPASPVQPGPAAAARAQGRESARIPRVRPSSVRGTMRPSKIRPIIPIEGVMPQQVSGTGLIQSEAGHWARARSSQS